MSRYELLADWTRGILYSLQWYVNFFAEPDTILVFKIFYGVFGEGTRPAMPKTIYAPD